MNNDTVSRTRMTAATQRRCECLRMVLEEFRQREMTLFDMQTFLNMSQSGTRKYIHDMRRFGVVEVSHVIEGTSQNGFGTPVYKITDNEEIERQFLELLTIPVNARKMPPKAVGRPNDLQRAMAGPGRHFHIMADDAHYAVQVNKTPAKRDPLVAALFGEAVKP